MATLCLACSVIPADYSKPDLVITATMEQRNPSWETEWQNEVWVFPKSIQVGHVDPALTNQHYQAGIKVIYPILIHADKNPTQFHLYYKALDYNILTSTYSPAPAKAIEWVHFPEPDPYLEAYETREVNMEFFVPKNASAPARWEFLVRVDWEQAGFFLQARGIRIQVNMKAIHA